MTIVVYNPRNKIVVHTLYETDSENKAKTELTYDLLQPRPPKDRSVHPELGMALTRQDSYRHFLAEVHPEGPLYLADDRVLHSDLLAESEAREEAVEYAHIALASDRSRKNQISATVTLERAIRNAADTLRSLAYGGQRSGVAGGQNAYLDVLRQLGRPKRGDIDEAEAYERVLKRVGELAEQNERYAEFELVPKFDAVRFLGALRKIPRSRRETAISIIEPFVESLDQRLAGLSEAERITREFLRQANTFLLDKQVYFQMRRGITVRSSPNSEALSASSLSSGERHLMLLLCSTLIARERFNLFIIDEPELSLNVKWQRTVMQALLRLTEGTNVQFITATHSIEMISRNKPSLIRLRSEA